MAFVKKKTSAKNQEERVAYETEYTGKTIDEHWSYITFTDEAHVDLTSQPVGEILREEGHRYDDENIQERGEKKALLFTLQRGSPGMAKQRN
jgi:hypothetical protein